MVLDIEGLGKDVVPALNCVGVRVTYKTRWYIYARYLTRRRDPHNVGPTSGIYTKSLQD